MTLTRMVSRHLRSSIQYRFGSRPLRSFGSNCDGLKSTGNSFLPPLSRMVKYRIEACNFPIVRSFGTDYEKPKSLVPVGPPKPSFWEFVKEILASWFGKASVIVWNGILSFLKAVGNSLVKKCVASCANTIMVFITGGSVVVISKLFGNSFFQIVKEVYNLPSLRDDVNGLIAQILVHDYYLKSGPFKLVSSEMKQISLQLDKKGNEEMWVAIMKAKIF